MNTLTIRDQDGQVIRERALGPDEVVWISLGEHHMTSATISAPPGWQLNGHRFDCRCGTCRPDIWRLA